MAFSVRPRGPARLRMRAAPRPGDVPPGSRPAPHRSAPRACAPGPGSPSRSRDLRAARRARAPLGPPRRPPARAHELTPRGRGGDFFVRSRSSCESAAGTAWVPLRRHVTAAPRAGGGPRLGPPRRSPARDHAITPRGRGGDCSSAPACPTKSAAGTPWVSLCRHVTSAPRAGRGPRRARCAGCRLGVTCLTYGVRGGDESSAPAFLAASTCCGSAGRATGVAPRLGWAGRHTWAVQPAICNRPSWDKQVPPNECHDGAHCVTGQR